MTEDSNSPVKAYLDRSGDRRPCTLLEAAYSPRERDGQLIGATDRRMLVSVIAPDGTELVPPDSEFDTLILRSIEDSSEEVLRIVAPPGRTSPGGVNVFWELQVRE